MRWFCADGQIEKMGHQIDYLLAGVRNACRHRPGRRGWIKPRVCFAQLLRRLEEGRFAIVSRAVDIQVRAFADQFQLKVIKAG